MSDNLRKCARCGSTNPVGMKFCGMCGAQLPTADEIVVTGPPRILEAPEPVLPAAPEVSGVPAQPAETAAPAYTGGAFRLMGQEIDPGSRSLDYLLEDDEERSSRAPWLIGMLIALALAGGLGYYRYRNGNWPSLRSASSGATQTNSAGASSTPADNTVSAPAPGAGATDGSTPDGSNAPSAANGAITDVRPNIPASAPQAAALPPSASGAAGAPAAEAIAPATKSPAASEVAPAPKPKPPAPVKAEDPVSLGEKYIYGRGVPQNCDRGVKLVRPAADAASSKGMITMGALYATGLCVARDLPTAYKYFALALRKDPDNAALKQNVERVWGQMTQLERQQAIRLTQ